ncbi:hypothetical protein LNQ03_17100 [Klebsiella pneumoniae subsp. pneumoniae]|nr:hypothetical protein [Klebsiella pneumoniae subsp. pneumoniae]
MIKTRPFRRNCLLGTAFKHFSPQDADSLTRPVANGRLDVDSPVTLMAELGHGLFGAPGIEGHRQGWMPPAVHHQRSAARGPDADPGQRRSAGRPAPAERDRVGCQRRAERAPWRDQSARQPSRQVDRLAVTLPVAERAREVMAFHGRWIREFQPHRLTLEHDSFSAGEPPRAHLLTNISRP